MTHLKDARYLRSCVRDGSTPNADDYEDYLRERTVDFPTGDYFFELGDDDSF